MRANLKPIIKNEDKDHLLVIKGREVKKYMIKLVEWFDLIL